MRLVDIISVGKTTGAGSEVFGIYECPHCGHKKKMFGRTDDHYLRYTLKNMKCEECGKREEEE